MEFSLHRQLKSAYSGQSDQVEAVLGPYRIDVLRDDTLVEIQVSALSAIRGKIAKLIDDYHVTVVKPIVARKWIIKRESKDGPILHRRLSPKRGFAWSLFEEFVSLARIFPHPNLVVDAPLVSIEETRYPGHGKRRRRRNNDFRIEDQSLVSIEQSFRLTSPDDLLALLPTNELPQRFGTAELAEAVGVHRWFAQRIAYCLRETGAVQLVGKAGNALLYEQTEREIGDDTPTASKSDPKRAKAKKKRRSRASVSNRSGSSED